MQPTAPMIANSLRLMPAVERTNVEQSGRRERSSTPMGAPERADDDVLLVVGVVDMTSHLAKVDAAKSRHAGVGVGRPGSGKERHDAEGLF